MVVNRSKMIQSNIRKNRSSVLTHIIISPNLKKIHRAVFEIQSGTDGRTDGRTEKGEFLGPFFQFWRGTKKSRNLNTKSHLWTKTKQNLGKTIFIFFQKITKCHTWTYTNEKKYSYKLHKKTKNEQEKNWKNFFYKIFWSTLFDP